MDPQQARPNFVIILTDDQGRWAMPHRMPELVMPHLATFLEESLELNQMYCASPVCSPSRASMMTGRMPSAHGVHDWLVGGRHPEAHPDLYLDGQPTTPEVLADAGWQCAMSGKWHVGDSRLPAPGFEFWYAHRFGGGSYYDAPIWRDGVEAEEPRYFTDAVTDNALDFLASRDRSRPFYLQVNYTAPHSPWIDNNHPRELLDLYAETDFPSVPREEPHPWVEPRKADFADAFADPHPHLAGFCASLTAVDTSLGRIRTVLEEQGVSEDTVVVYLSDNGFSCGHHGIWGKGNGTYPLNFWDNSVRVPCVVHVPGGAVGTSEALLSSVSLHHTLCDLAGVDVPSDRWSAGASFADVLRGGDGGEDFVVVLSEYGGARMITDGRTKLVERFDGPNELYDLVQDPDERDNRFDDPSLRVTRDELLEEMHRRFDAQTRPGASGWDRPVSGFGQIQPTSRGLPADRCYAQGLEGFDGVRVPAPGDASAAASGSITIS